MKKSILKRVVCCVALVALASAVVFAAPAKQAKPKPNKYEKMLTKGDPVDNIKKLTNTLKKKPADQDAADVLDKLVKQTQDSLLDVIAPEPADVVAVITNYMKAGSAMEALQKVKASITDGSLVWDDPRTKVVLDELKKMEYRANDWYLMLSYVETLPETIGVDPQYNTKEYQIIKAGYPFIKDKQKAIYVAEGDFKFLATEVQIPVTKYEDKETLFKHFQQSYTTPAEFANKQNAYDRMVEYGLMCGNEKLDNAKALIAAKRYAAASLECNDARVTFRDLNKFDPKKTAASKVLEGYYIDGEAHLALAHEQKMNSPAEAKKTAEAAARCFKDAENFSNAKAKKAEADNLVTELNAALGN